MTKTIIAALAGLALVGCGQDTVVIRDTVPDTEPAIEYDDADLNAVLFEFVWGEMTPTEQDDTCWGYNEFGPAVSYELFLDGWGDDPGAPTRTEFTTFFDSVC